MSTLSELIAQHSRHDLLEVTKILDQLVALAQSDFENNGNNKNKKNKTEVFDNPLSSSLASIGLDFLHFETFLRSYYQSVALEELKNRPLKDLLAIALCHWRAFIHRPDGETRLRVFNPSVISDGWSSSRTVIQLTQDDMPFLIDSMVLELHRMNIRIHFVLHTACFSSVRDSSGKLLGVYNEQNTESAGDPLQKIEAPVYLEIDFQGESPEILSQIHENLLGVLKNVRLAVESYPMMREKLKDAMTDLKTLLDLKTIGSEKNKPENIKDVEEAIDFLNWLDDSHFTYLGYAEYLKQDKKNFSEQTLSADSKQFLGLLLDYKNYKDSLSLGKWAQAHVLDEGQPLLVAKSDIESNVHRKCRMDVIVTPLYKNGECIGERRFLGLFTSVAYHASPLQIPFISRKANLVLKAAGFDQRGHAGKALVSILQDFPRDELFHIDQSQLLKISLDILNIQERQALRLFIIQDALKLYYACMIYLPRDLFNTDLRLKIQSILMEELRGDTVDFEPVFFDSSLLCRIDFLIHASSAELLSEQDIYKLEQKLILAARDWRDDLKDLLVKQYGETRLPYLLAKYGRAFPAGYREAFLPHQALIDIEHMEKVLSGDVQVGMCFYRLMEESEQQIRFKLFQKNEPIPLTFVLPIIENMGLSVMEERPYEIKNLKEKESIWISDFGMRLTHGLINPSEVAGNFEEAFSKVWERSCENDGFNRLVMRAGLNWREINILRAYGKYLLQIGSPYSQNYLEDTLSEYPKIAKLLVNLFFERFDPTRFVGGAKNQAISADRLAACKNLEQEILKNLEEVRSIDRDKILRRFLEIIKATLRTNFFQKIKNSQNSQNSQNSENSDQSEFKSYVSFKIQSELISNMPKPVPKFEIFVFSRCMEGVHLRGGKVARGGLRWSDRREDFRREVLGLLKAQQVKNSIIVPFGAKGGFIAKCLPEQGTRDEIMAEGIACYKIFIRGMLDITDNRLNDEIIPPPSVIRYDEDDPYFVVAADKGTATFSDIANAVAKEYQFWLGDAFASGGSNGYDHKKMGITARGAIESAKRHFLGLGKNILNEDFTCVGVGDMSGDVFGNGMLLSRHIRLIAAFDHRHIFIDPDPVAEVSYEERLRLFNLPRSSWADYNLNLLSKGGGVFERAAKIILLTPEMQKLFKLKDKKIEPSALIQEILKLRVEMFYNGGIGTYIKSSQENHFTLGDRANDDVRVDASEVRVKVIVEGGNVGVTQLGRIEFAQKGGLIFTDAVDNSAGVDCSDHEVNVKILLKEAIDAGCLLESDRDQLLAHMKDDIARLVLSNNYHQTQALNNSLLKAPDVLYMQLRLVRELEREGFLDRQLEFLPTDKEIKARFANDQGLTAPELAVLMAYSKSAVKGEIFNSSLPDESYFDIYLAAEFPEILSQKFSTAVMRKHYLAKEIIVTQLTNEMLHRMGMGYVHRLYDETGASPAMIARAYAIAQSLCGLSDLWAQIEALDGHVSAAIQQLMMQDLVRWVRRVSRWVLKNHRDSLNVSALIQEYAPKVEALRELVSKFLSKEERYVKKEYLKKLTSNGVPNELAMKASDYHSMSAVMDIIWASSTSGLPLQEMAEVYYELNDYLDLFWFKQSACDLREEGYWGTLASSSLTDDMEHFQAQLALSILKTNVSVSSQKLNLHTEDKNQDKKVKFDNIKSLVDAWANQHRYGVNRWHYTIENLKGSKHEMIMYLVAIRGLSDLAAMASAGLINK